MKRSIFWMILWLPIQLLGQTGPDSLSLKSCYQQVEAAYPLTKKVEIEHRISELNQRIASSGLYPEVQLKASASYQSDVTEVPFSAPGTNPTEFSKDHYNVALELNQTIYDGGLTRNSEVLEQTKSETENAGIKADMWSVRRQLEQVYFGILQLQKNKETTHLLKEEIQEQLDLVNARVENGVLLPSNALALEAEMLTVEQKMMLIESEIDASYDVLSLILGEEISTDTRLLSPEKQVLVKYDVAELSRPELEVFTKRMKLLDIQQKLSGAVKLPKVTAFGTAAYGRPGLDMFNNDLQTYWLVGVRAQWSFRNWNNSGKKREVLELQKRKLQTDEEIFRLNVNSALSKIERTIYKLEKQIKLDEKVLNLRKQVTEEKAEQLKQGTITSTEYLTELNTENRALLQLELRRIQLNQYRIEYLTQKGISWN